MNHKAPYRNAIRSKKLIQQAYMQLMKQKDVVRIKVCEVIELANVSKGTFYAHYTCLYDVQQEIENEHLAMMFRVFEENPPTLMLVDLYPLFLCGLQEMDKDRECFRMLLGVGYGDSFLNKVKHTFLEYMMSCNANSEYLQSEHYTRAYLTYVAGGAIALIQGWLESSNREPVETVARFLSECAVNGIRGVREQVV